MRYKNTTFGAWYNIPVFQRFAYISVLIGVLQR